MTDLHGRVAEVLRSAVRRDDPLAGGCVGDVRKLTLQDGRRVVAKRGRGLALEGMMLSYLIEYTRLPVPAVLYADDDLLLLEYVESGEGISDSAETDAAEHLAALHGVTAPRFGFACDTVIGGLPQPNAESGSWIEFFRDRRLMHMARMAYEAGQLPGDVLGRVEDLCGRLDRWIKEPDAPRLIHGDMWTGNVLVRGGRVAAFVDPALSYADPEIELAFATLFGTFGEAFFRRYGELRPIAPGFFEERRGLYNLYPLLVHVRLFGGSYVPALTKNISELF